MHQAWLVMGLLRVLGLGLLSVSVLMCTRYDDDDDYGDDIDDEGFGHVPAVGTPGEGGDTSSSSSSSGAGGAGGVPAEVCRFDAEIAFALPSGFATDQLDDASADESGSCAEGQLSYGTRDMDGDGRPDLVVTDRCDHAGVGTTEWLVYLNIGDGFADSPASWTLPATTITDQFDDLDHDSHGPCVESDLSYGLLDMTGDQRPDLVLTDSCDLAGVGTTEWLVYENTGDGFAGSPIVWTLPSGYGTDQLDDLHGDGVESCLVGELSVSTRDMNGDRRPDLVVTDRCDTAGVGTDHWLVYQNLGDGFADVATVWALPTDFGTDDLDDVFDTDTGSCFIGELSFGLRDMDGDLSPDLVVTDNCDSGGVGASHWRVYLNEGEGFASSPLLWTLHGLTASDEIDDLSGDSGASCVYSELSYEVLDANGDDAADLLITDRCDSEGVGSTHWLLFRADTTRFAEPGSWTLPDTLGFDALDDAFQDEGNYCAQGELSTSLIDMNGDGISDLVVADDCDIDGVGSSHWRVFLGACDAL